MRKGPESEGLLQGGVVASVENPREDQRGRIVTRTLALVLMVSALVVIPTGATAGNSPSAGCDAVNNPQRDSQYSFGIIGLFGPPEFAAGEVLVFHSGLPENFGPA